MSKNTKAAVVAVAIAASGLGLYKLGSKMLSAEPAKAEHLSNQVWISRLPGDSRDIIGHIVFIEHRRGKFGAVGRSSQWRHSAEIFQWNVEGEVLGMHFPQDRVKGKAKVRTWECEGEAPEPFELCLEISNGDRKVNFYSRKDWEIDVDRASKSFAKIVEDEPALSGMTLPEGIEDLEQDDELDVDSLPNVFTF